MCYARTRPLIRQLIITTLMLTLAMIYVRHLPLILALAFCLSAFASSVVELSVQFSVSSTACSLALA